MPLPIWLPYAAQGVNMLADLGAGYLQRGTDKENRKRLEEQQAQMRRSQGVGNLIGAMSGGRINYQPTVDPVRMKENKGANILSSIGKAVGIGGQVVGGIQQAQQLMDQQGMAKTAFESGEALKSLQLQQSQNQLDQQAGQGKFFQQQSLKAPDRARQMSVVEQGPTVANLQAPQMLQQGRQDAIQNTNPIGAMQALGFGRAKEAAAASELAQASQMQGMDIANRQIGVSEGQLQVSRENLEYNKILARAKASAAKVASGLKAGQADQDRFFDISNDFRKQPLIKDASEFQRSFGVLMSLVDDLQTNGFTGAGQIAAVNAFQRLIDPATVREGDVALLRSAQSVFDRAGTEMAKLTKGAVVSEQLVDEMRRSAVAMATVFKNSATDVADAYFTGLGDLGVNPDLLNASRKSLSSVYDFKIPELKMPSTTPSINSPMIEVPGVGSYSVDEVREELYRKMREANMQYIGQFSTGSGAR